MEQLDLFTEQEDKSLLKAFGWWGKSRLVYNLNVGTKGLACILILSLIPLLAYTDLLDIIIYGIFANMFYFLVFLIIVISRHYFKSKIDFTEKRKTIFGLGLVMSVIITIGLCFLYASIQSSPFKH